MPVFLDVRPMSTFRVFRWPAFKRFLILDCYPEIVYLAASQRSVLEQFPHGDVDTRPTLFWRPCKGPASPRVTRFERSAHMTPRRPNSAAFGHSLQQQVRTVVAFDPKEPSPIFLADELLEVCAHDAVNILGEVVEIQRARATRL